MDAAYTEDLFIRNTLRKIRKCFAELPEDELYQVWRRDQIECLLKEIDRLNRRIEEQQKDIERRWRQNALDL